MTSVHANTEKPLKANLVSSHGLGVQSCDEQAPRRWFLTQLKGTFLLILLNYYMEHEVVIGWNYDWG